MIKVLKKEQMGNSDLGWLKSRFHFSFAEYRNPQNVNFGVLRVLNDDLIAPHSGFDTHPHENMEIISYIVDGTITHKDSMGNAEELSRGEVQYMSAGDGVLHSEHNMGDEMLRLLQIWIYPPQKGLARLYGSHRYTKEQRDNKLLCIVGKGSPVQIHQDVRIFVCELDESRHIEHSVESGKQIYFVLIEGSASVNGEMLEHGDACEITDESLLSIKAKEKSHFLFIEMGD